MERLSIEAADGLILNTRMWRPEGEVRALLQLAHGAGEHLGRYQALAEALNTRGILVAGADHRGHGHNRDLHGLGDFGPRGFDAVVEDMASVAKFIRIQFPTVPLVLLGHSMGSFAAQVFATKHAELLDGLVLSGTTAIDVVLEAGAGGSLAALNADFEPARTQFDWLSRDAAEVNRYIADPLCGFDPAPHSMSTMARTVAGAREPHRLAAAIAKQLPLLLLSGEADPVGGPQQVLAVRAADDYRRAGLAHVEHWIYPGARHELFFETNRKEVVSDFVRWVENLLNRAA